jgi:hypothetical protein
MKKFILNTTSESGDDYTYFIKHSKKPSPKELLKFLKVNGSDKDDDEVYENVQSITEIKEEEFLLIP